MPKTQILLIFVLLNFTFSLAQSTFVDSLNKESQNQLIFEKVYIHTNTGQLISELIAIE